MARIAFIIRSLSGGGAERQMLALARGLGARGHHCAIITWIDDLAYPEDLLQSNVMHLRVPPGDGSLVNVPFLARRIGRVLTHFQPDVIHGYLDPGNFFASTARLWLPHARIAWGIRASNLHLHRYELRGRILARLNALGARSADVLIANSHAGAAHVIRLGYPYQRLEVISNGIDIDRFRPDLELRRRQRETWGVCEGQRIIGMAARLDPMKDHGTFAKAAMEVASRHADVRFVCVGEGIDPYRSGALAALRASGLGDVLRWQGFCQDMVAFYNGLDLATSTSAFGEGFSNAIGEAMACGTPCVVTDVGDGAWIVGSTGTVVPPRDPGALAYAWEAALAKTGSDWLTACRRRIAEHFSVDTLVRNTECALGL